MKHILYLSSYLVLFSILLSGCGEKKVVKSGPVEIPVVEVIQDNITLTRDFVGQVYGDKDIPIRARVEGFLEGIHFNEGLLVEKGQLLYSIDPQPFEAKVNSQKSKLAEAKTHLAKAESDLNRYKPLAAENAVSQSDLDAAQAGFDAAQASVNAARSNLRSAEIEMGYTKIYSPLDGLIGITLAKAGDFVGREPNPVILNTVSKTDHVKVKFYLTEAEYILISREYVKQDKEVKNNEDIEESKARDLQLQLSDGSIYKHAGSVDFVDRGVDATTGSILVQASFPNPQLLLRPGMYAKVIASLREVKDGLLVPQRCIQELQGQYSVFLVDNENKIVSRKVTLGSTYQDYWMIKGGLKAGDKIVLEGMQKVRPGMEIKPVINEFESKFVQQ